MFGLLLPACQPGEETAVPPESAKADGVSVARDGSVSVDGDGAFELVVDNRTEKELILKAHRSDKSFTRPEAIPPGAKALKISLQPALLRGVRLAFYDRSGSEYEMTHIESSSYSGPSGSVQRISCSVIEPGAAATVPFEVPQWVLDLRKRSEEFGRKVREPVMVADPAPPPATADVTLTVLSVGPEEPVWLAIESGKDVIRSKIADGRFERGAVVRDVRSKHARPGTIAFYTEDGARHAARVVVALVAKHGVFSTDPTRIGAEPVTQPGESVWLFVEVLP